MSSRYQEWLTHVFDHEIQTQLPQWYVAVDAPEFAASETEIAELLGQTFISSGKDLTKYTDARVDQGIWYIANSHQSAFQSPNVPLAKRVETIGSIFYLYSDCFAKRCSETLGHLGEEGSPLNSSCYMFWDITSLDYLKNAPDSQQMQDAALDVLQKILTIEHRACREAAFHGLSGYAFIRPEKAEEIIDQFLNKTKLDDKLLAYALNARQGNVL
jgi:hypothetical protein